jgi:hypothetical protein
MLSIYMSYLREAGYTVSWEGMIRSEQPNERIALFSPIAGKLPVYP